MGRPKKNQSNQQNVQNNPLQCPFCLKVFSTEKYLINHLCESKRRVLQRSERPVTIGFASYRRFWKCRMNPKAIVAWEDFEKSSLYSAFVRFGRYIISNNAINPNGFVDFLIRLEVGIDDWCKSSYYQAYVRELNKSETPIEALQRNMMLMEQWAISENMHWTDFFRKVSPPQAVMWIVSGRLSPWVFLTATSSKELLDRMTDEQLDLINEVIDEKFWEIKLKKYQKDVDTIVAELSEFNV